MSKENNKDLNIPNQNDTALFDQLDLIEPRSMHGQPKVVWHSAQGCFVYDRQGNKFLDFTSGVLVANAGHNHPAVNSAIKKVVDRGLLTSYIFVNEERIKLIKKILEHTPHDMEQVLLFCSGSEAIEASIKLSRAWAIKNYGQSKRIVLSFQGNFHGRTLGSQLAGGIPALKDWIIDLDKNFIQLPYPNPNELYAQDFNNFLNELNEYGINYKEQISCVLFETYQGGSVKFAPIDFMQQLRNWCDKNDIKLIMDEVQAGFGRTGKWWGFEHYNIEPDIIVCGKGISSSLPISAVIGSRDIMDQFPPGALSTTHSGNPVCCAAAAANIEVIENDNLAENARTMGDFMLAALNTLIKDYTHEIEGVYGQGLVAGIHFKTPETAQNVVDACIKKGLMLFNPVGPKGSTLKINPPLCIDEKTLNEGMIILERALKEIIQ